MTRFFYNNNLSLLQPLFYRWVKWRYRKPRWINKRGIHIHLLPSVFHPSIYQSTDIFLDFLLSQEVEGKAVLELGTGSGFIAMYLAHQKQCVVTATDINPAAIRGLDESCERNNIKLTTICSDLLDHVPNTCFNYILVNPPFYNKDINSVDEYAFFCGANFEYFNKLFNQLESPLIQQSKVYMILSNTAQLEVIKNIAQRHKLKMNVVFQKKNKTEVFFIYELEKEKSFAINNIN